MSSELEAESSLPPVLRAIGPPFPPHPQTVTPCKDLKVISIFPSHGLLPVGENGYPDTQ